MELQSHVAAKKLWSYLRLAFLTMRKSFASKRKLLMDVKLLMERGKLLGIKSLGLISQRRRVPAFRGRYPFDYEYEFSCSNSPEPVVFCRAAAKPRHSFLFPCLHAAVLEETSPRMIAPSPGGGGRWSSSQFLEVAVGPGERRRTPTSSPFAVRVSDFEEEEEAEELVSRQVDDEAEEFIRMFYEQLRAQSRMALLPYQE